MNEILSYIQQSNIPKGTEGYDLLFGEACTLVEAAQESLIAALEIAFEYGRAKGYTLHRMKTQGKGC